MYDLAPLVTRIVSVSLCTGTVPSGLKQALVTPILKKNPGLDANDLRNFRPVSNLPFVSKILERAVLLQLQSHLSTKISQYRNFCFELLEGLLTKSDQKLVSVLALLDLSAAFDTLDHAILLRRLESTFGISGLALSWFESYLSDRTQSVVVGSLMSIPIPLVFGVPQGSVLGPVLFTLYSQPLSDVLARHSCDYHKYADDTEISDSAPPSDFTSAQSNIQSCISDTLSWMQSNKLKLNTEKNPEMMLVGSSVRISSVGCESADIDESCIPFQTSLECILTRRCQ